MRNGPDDREKRSVRALRDELRDTDDGKIRRVLAIVDASGNPAFNQNLLGSLRPRLAVLRPPRPPVFARLLLTPLNPLIVPAPAWRPGMPAVPRTILASVTKTVRAGLGGETQAIDTAIAGCGGDEVLAQTRIGEVLWPRAAEILAGAALPEDWPETGLRPALWPCLAQSIAAVFRRASQLRRFARDHELGAAELDEDQINGILEYSAGEPPEACGMIVHLILARVPRAAQLMRRFTWGPAETIILRQAIDQAFERMLSEMEVPAAFTHDVGGAELAGATAQLRRMTALLREIEQDNSASLPRFRLRAIRETLDDACRARFDNGIRDGVVAPLSGGSPPVDAAGQKGLEARARDLCGLAAAAREVSDSASYDEQLRQASEAARRAVDAGTLTPIRQMRLTEILIGPDAAEAMYWKDKAPRPPPA